MCRASSSTGARDLRCAHMSEGLEPVNWELNLKLPCVHCTSQHQTHQICILLLSLHHGSIFHLPSLMSLSLSLLLSPSLSLASAVSCPGLPFALGPLHSLSLLWVRLSQTGKLRHSQASQPTWPGQDCCTFALSMASFSSPLLGVRLRFVKSPSVF